jgi:hypothetical protein
LTPSPEERIRSLLARAQRFLLQGRLSDAIFLLQRAVLLDPARDAARDALERARGMEAERRRQFEASVAAAEPGRPSAEPPALPSFREGVGIRRGVQARVEAPRAAAAGHPLSRRVFFAAWSAGVVLLGASAAVGWDSLMQTLVRNPAADGRRAGVLTRLAAPRPGDLALSEARRLLDDGEPALALAVLDAIPPDEPVYPFARQVRARAAARIHAGGPQP